jgi:hypothetical protein
MRINSGLENLQVFSLVRFGRKPVMAVIAEWLLFMRVSLRILLDDTQLSDDLCVI